MKDKQSILVLEDGSIFYGKAFGSAKTVVGECVFNTSMTGYEEIITDPSYYMQIVTMTASQIGNYGITGVDGESDSPKISALVVRELSPVVSNWRAKESLEDYLNRYDIPGIQGIDTRLLTKVIRERGAMKACLSTEGISSDDALRRARAWTGTEGSDYVKALTAEKAYHWHPETDERALFSVAGTTLYPERKIGRRFKLAAIDFGAKRSIFRQLDAHGFDVHIFPATSTAESILASNPDALFLSNGPGDPAAVTYAHATVAACIGKLPIFGICLGHQIIAHAIGAKTYKLKFGHRGGNQPVKHLEDDIVIMTAQNHGFAVDAERLESCGGIVTEINLNDATVAGFRLVDHPVFCVQYHPEAGPGPNEGIRLFQKFYDLVAEAKK